MGTIGSNVSDLALNQILSEILVPQAGLEPALLSEPHFECGASTNFTTGAKPWTAGGMFNALAP